MNIAPDFPIMLSGWLQVQFGDDATITHEDSASPIGMNDCAEVFTVALPGRYLDRLYMIQQKTGTAGEPFTTIRGKASLRVRLVQPVDIPDCRNATARRQFTVHAQVNLW